MTLLKHLVDGDEGLERLDFVGKDWLSGNIEDDSQRTMIAQGKINQSWTFQTYTFMPAQND